MTPDRFLEELNRLVAPLLPRSPSYRFFRLRKGVARNRRELRFAWTTQRCRGPNGAPVGFYAFVYEVVPVDENSFNLICKRNMRFSRRSKAKARARAWYDRRRVRAVTVRERPAIDPDLGMEHK